MDRNYSLSLPLADDFNAYVNAALENDEITKDEFDYILMRAETAESPYVDAEHIIFTHYMENYLAAGGRLIIGPYWYEKEDLVQRKIRSWGISPTGYSEKTHYKKSGMMKKVMWFEKGTGYE